MALKKLLPDPHQKPPLVNQPPKERVPTRPKIK